MNIEKKREEFEAAYMASMDTDLPPSVWLERRANGSYASVSTKAAWWAWQASRAAIEIELPKLLCEDEEEVGDDWSINECYNNGIKGCLVAIEAAGLKVK